MLGHWLRGKEEGKASARYSEGGEAETQMPRPANTSCFTIITCKSVQTTPGREDQYTRYHVPTLPAHNQSLGDSILLGGGGVRNSPSIVTGVCIRRFLGL